MRITQLENPPSLELTTPPDMRLRIVEGPGDRPAHAQLTGKDGVITIESPAILWSGLAEYLKARSPKDGEAIHSQQLASGFLVISRVAAKRTPEGYRYYATVSRPDLLVECKVHRTYKVTALAQIKKLASICLSLRPGPPEE